MSIAIRKFRTSEASLPDFAQLDRVFQEIRQRPCSLSEERGFSSRSDFDDWIAAEHEILWSPPVELIENDNEFRARIAAPAFAATEIQVTAFPDAIVVQAESVQKHENVEGEVRISELGSRKLYRRVELPSPIDVDKITVTLDEGVLHLMASKAAQPKRGKGLSCHCSTVCTEQSRLPILTVGLNEEDHWVLRQVVGRSGGTLSCSATLAEAMRFMQRKPTPVIVCESNLADGCWRDLLAAAATVGRPPNVIVTSRLADERLWAEVLNLGGFDVLPKPLDSFEVFRVLGSAWRDWHDRETSQEEKADAVMCAEP